MLGSPWNALPTSEHPKSLADYVEQMRNAQSGIGAANTATGMQITVQQAAAAQRVAMNEEILRGAKNTMNISLREISNGYMVAIGKDETYVEDLNDVGGVIAARWATKILGDEK